MEIKTTMVRFSIAKNRIQKRTEKAILFEIDNDKIWIPLKKMNLKPSDNDNFYKVEMPKWVFFKTTLPLHVEPEEYDYIQEID